MTYIDYNQKLREIAIQSEDNSAEEQPEEEITKVLTFSIGEQVYGIEIENVAEIIEVPPITLVPDVPDYIKGVINVRSKIIPVINIRTRFKKEEIPFTDKTCIIIVYYEDSSVGIITDSVTDVAPVLKSHIADTPNINSVNSEKYIKYVLENKNGTVLILDTDRLLNVGE